jgi:hypothetical protein
VSENVTNQGLTRRELLKKGAILGGALAWATPTVQIIGMQPAFASHVSDVCLCVKFGACNDSGNWQVLGADNPGNCLEPGPDHPSNCDRQFQPDSTFRVVDSAGECGLDEFCIQFNESSITIYFPEYCTLIAFAEKAANDCHEQTGLNDSSGEATFDITSACSHLEFCFQC